MNFATAHASVRGTSHLKSGKPCEDAATVAIAQDTQWTIAVLCDGAGSAKNAEKGAKFTSSYFYNSLEKISQKLNQNQPGPWLTDDIIQEVINLRSSLRQKVGDDNMHDYHCTLVACLLSDTGGFAIHIGDGAIFGEDTDRNEVLISAPENGQYANETFFITEPHWLKHLRVTPIPKMLWVALCTDGGAALAMQNEKATKKGFVYPCIQALLSKSSRIDSDKVVLDFLSDPMADAVTSDDKTLAFLLSPNLETYDFQIPQPTNTSSIPSISPSVSTETGISRITTGSTLPQAEETFPIKIISKTINFCATQKLKIFIAASLSVALFLILFMVNIFISDKNNLEYIDEIQTNSEVEMHQKENYKEGVSEKEFEKNSNLNGKVDSDQFGGETGKENAENRNSNSKD